MNDKLREVQETAERLLTLKQDVRIYKSLKDEAGVKDTRAKIDAVIAGLSPADCRLVLGYALINADGEVDLDRLNNIGPVSPL